jgi:SAM-dependent methyltransferase
MSLATDLQPDQKPERWNDHVAVYEEVFEPLTNVFASRALDLLDLAPGERVLDVGAGAGGAALMAAARGAEVVAIDASPPMVARIGARANGTTGSAGSVRAEVMDGMALGLPDGGPDADLGLREIARVLRPGGRAAIVTWTDTERYELASRLFGAISAVRGPQPPPFTLPAQLRFRDEAAFRRLLAGAGLSVDAIVRVAEHWRIPSARWIADRIAFAPGMAATLDALGPDRKPVLDAFVAGLERDQGRSEVVLSAVAHIGVARKPTEPA